MCLQDTKDHYWPGLVSVSEVKPKEGGEQNHFCLLWVIPSWTWTKTEGPENIQKTVFKNFTFLRLLFPKSNHPSSWRQKWDLGRQGKQGVYANTAWASPYKRRSNVRISTQQIPSLQWHFSFCPLITSAQSKHWASVIIFHFNFCSSIYEQSLSYKQLYLHLSLYWASPHCIFIFCSFIFSISRIMSIFIAEFCHFLEGKFIWIFFKQFSDSSPVLKKDMNLTRDSHLKVGI